MDAEMIRDQVLATSGTLDPRMYGRSVKPPRPRLRVAPSELNATSAHNCEIRAVARRPLAMQDTDDEIRDFYSDKVGKFPERFGEVRLKEEM